MKKMLLLSVLLALTALTGCVKTSFVYTNASPGDVTEESRTFMFFGLSAPDKPYRADKVCGDKGVQSVETFASIGNTCVSSITIQIYTPRTVKVTCASGSAHNFYLDEQDKVVAHEIVDPKTGQSVTEDFTSDVL